MKKITLIIFLNLINFTLVGQEVIENKQKPLNPNYKLTEIILRRQSSNVYPYESQKFFEKYPFGSGGTGFSEGTTNNKVTNLYFGIKYFIPRFDSFLDYSFNEIKKADLSKIRIICESESCNYIPYSIGSYYRLSTEINFNKFIYSDKLSLGGGIRYIQSNLSLNFPNSYDLYMNSTSVGPQVSFKFKTGDFLGIYFSGKFEYFYLFGNLLTRNGAISKNYWLGFNYFENQVNSKYYGGEVDLAINYKINESLTFSIGGTRLDAKIKPKNKNIVSLDSTYDLNYNVTAANFGYVYYDRIYSIYFQISFKL